MALEELIRKEKFHTIARYTDVIQFACREQKFKKKIMLKYYNTWNIKTKAERDVVSKLYNMIITDGEREITPFVIYPRYKYTIVKNERYCQNMNYSGETIFANK